MRILITDGAGFMGSNLALRLKDQEVAEDRYDRSIRELAAKGRYRG
jgi:nucleoside-diphosphate-sugar epimerase